MCAYLIRLVLDVFNQEKVCNRFIQFTFITRTFRDILDLVKRLLFKHQEAQIANVFIA